MHNARTWDGKRVAGSTDPDTPAADVAAVAAVRRAVQRALDGLAGPARGAPLLVACSGGADSTALLAAARARRRGDGGVGNGHAPTLHLGPGRE